MMLLIFYFLFLIFLLIFAFWLVSMIISTMTQAPYVVSNDNAILKALELSQPKAGELIYDLGCGDARVLRLASSKYQTRGVGYEISPFCILLSRIKNRFYRLSKKIDIRRGSLFKADVENADIIFLYLTNKILDQIENDLFSKIKPTCRVVNLAFPFKNHKPKTTLPVRQLARNTCIYLYLR